MPEAVPNDIPIIQNTEQETEWVTAPNCDTIASAALTNLTPGTITPIFPAGATLVRAILIANIHLANITANPHHVAFSVQGNIGGGAYQTLLNLAATAQLGLVAADGCTDSWSGAIDVTALVTTSGSVYNFRFVIDSDNANTVRYITSFALVLIYHM